MSADTLQLKILVRVDEDSTCGWCCNICCGHTLSSPASAGRKHNQTIIHGAKRVKCGWAPRAETYKWLKRPPRKRCPRIFLMWEHLDRNFDVFASFAEGKQTKPTNCNTYATPIDPEKNFAFGLSVRPHCNTKT